MQDISIDAESNESTIHQGQWIGMEESRRGTAAPLLRREFCLNAPVRSAELMICGLGYYEAWINGRRVGNHVLDPAQTDYEERIFFVNHDVTTLIETGANAIGVIVGDGWFNQNRVWGENGFTYGTPRLWAVLKIETSEGLQLVAGDTDWRCATGPILSNNIYAGEVYDARHEWNGWSTAAFDDSQWHPAVLANKPAGKLQRQTLPPIRRIEELSPKAINAHGHGCYTVDMGQNFSGWARITVTAPAGTEISLRFAEALDDDGRIDTASTGVFATFVEQIDRYICKGNGAETWEPRFTYHGFRYVEVCGWPGELRTEDITGVVVHTDLATAGEFSCSDERLNLLHRMALWTHRSNVHGLPEDCPARERCGWLGDANVVAEYSMWNFHGKAFWEKYLDDIETSRRLHDGLPCNIAPGKRTCGSANPDWATAFIMLPWYCYVFYGDPTVLERHWAGMQQLMEHFIDSAQEGILEGGFGDWCDPGNESPCTHTPPTLTTSLWFFRCAQVMADVAQLLSRPAEADRYRIRSEKIRTAIVRRFYDTSAGTFGSQAADVMALQFGVVTDAEADRVLASLVNDVRKRDVHLNVGIMGLRFIFEVLTRHGHGELALALMRQDSYPSFGHLIQRGATTLWEWWGEPELEDSQGARSLNHPMMGGFDNWFYNTLVGIEPDPQHPGFKHFFLRPYPIAGLDWAQAHHESPHGIIRMSWRKQDDLYWQTAVPKTCTATLILPGSPPQELQAGVHEGHVPLA